MSTAFPQVYNRLLERYKTSFVSLYGSDYPDFEDIVQFEADMRDSKSDLKSLISSDVSKQLDIWGSSKLILGSAGKFCPESISSEGLPTISQVFLELVHSFVLLKEGLFADATKAARSVADKGSSSSAKVLSLFELSEGITNSQHGSTRSVQVIANIRNALAHSRIELTPGDEPKLIYDGSHPKEGKNQIERPLQDVILLGELMYRFTISVVHASELIQ